jgi:hypothetical protein
MLLLAGSTPIGGYLTGLIAEALGVSTAVAINASLCLLGVVAGLLYFAAHRRAFDAAPSTAVKPV